MAIASSGLTAATEPVVTNVRAAQRPGTIRVDITYDLEYAGTWPVRVSLAVSENSVAPFAAVTNGLSGAWGLGVVAGREQKIEWRAPASWLGKSLTDVRFKVSATVVPSGLVWIPPGTFTMGSPDGEAGRDADEGPVTEVTLSRGYWLGKNEVRQREWQGVMGNNPSHFEGNGEFPVKNVRWDEAIEYCRKLTDRERAAGRLPAGWEYQLPTEAQWEYGCRAGTPTRYSFGAGEGELGRYGWHSGNSGHQTHPVGQKEANGWGLYDMHGNVWEWCSDWWADQLPGGSVTDPKGPSSGSFRVHRGGSWFDNARSCRSANRGGSSLTDRSGSLGFRVALVQVP